MKYGFINLIFLFILRLLFRLSIKLHYHSSYSYWLKGLTYCIYSVGHFEFKALFVAYFIEQFYDSWELL